MIIRPFKGRINVGHRIYVEETEGDEGRPVSKFYWESTNRRRKRGTLDSIEKLIHELRSQRVDPEQVENGIERRYYPYPEKLGDKFFEKLIRGLSRPMIVVLKRYIPDSPTLGMGPDHPYLIEIGDASYKVPLEHLPGLLNDLGCTLTDVLFFDERKDKSYYPSQGRLNLNSN